ncbi:MAG TPA: FGGY-family carbohydrate kinase [Acidimicrobiales bacterium]|nr:FGGY-family carbohydrate kinase [Acidimicrobiales bacterium]
MTAGGESPDPDPAEGDGEEYVLAVDLGTGGPKVAVVSTTGRIVAHGFAPVPLYLLEGGGAEQDPDDWWAAICSAAHDALATAALPASKFIGVGCTSQWSGTVAVGSDGSPLRRAIIWMDSRGNRAIRAAAGGPVKVLGYDPRKILRWVRVTGGAPGLSGKDPVAHILFLRDQFPDIYRATVTFLEPVDYLNLRLTGRTSASFDSIAAHWVTDNRDIDRVTYDDRLLAITGLDRAKLPDLVPPGSIVGPLTPGAAADLGLPEGLPVSVGSGDVHSAVFGSGAVADFSAHLYIGTSSWISAHVPFKKTSITTNVASIPAALAGKYIVVNEHETAGACLTFLRDNLGIADDFASMNDLVEATPPGCGRVLFTPWLNGERSPVDDHTIRGGFHNLSLSTTRAELVRAVYEGVAFNNKWLLEAVEKFAGRTFDSMAFIGGGANSEPWCQIHADVLGREIRQVEEPVLANVRGAGLVTLVALGKVSVDQIPDMVNVRRTFTPDPATGPVYDHLYNEFVSLYQQTKGIHKRLNRF